MLYTEPELNSFAEFYIDKWDENTSEDVIAESFTDFWWNTDRACRNTRIRENIALAESAGSGKSIFEYDSNSNGAKDYLALTEEILSRNQ